MTSDAWKKQFCNLIRRYTSSSDVAAFRNEYRDLVREASPDVAKILLEAREYLESWTSPQPPDPATAYNQWEELYQAAKGKIPGVILEAFLRRFPRSKETNSKWESFLLECSDRRLIQALLNSRLIDRLALGRLAEKRTAQLYQSIALDVLVERSLLRRPRALWDELLRAGPRPAGLLSREEVLLYLYAATPGEQANMRLLSFLANASEDTQRVLELFLDRQQEAMRFCHFLTFGSMAGGARAAHKPGVDLRRIMINWVERCQATIEAGVEPRSIIASLVLGLIHLSQFTGTDEAVSESGGELAEFVGSASERVAANVLQRLEDDRSSTAGGIPLVILGDQLYRLVQEYLHRLPVNPAAEGSPERAARFQRYLGAKQVLEPVIAVIEDRRNERSLRDALEAALFNCGVRPLGTAQQEVGFDARVHQAESSGILPGDRVIITQGGRRLGNSEHGIVLVKARVRATSGPSAGQISETS